MEELLNPVQEEPVMAETVEVVDIQFRPGQKIYFFDPDGMQFSEGDHVVMDTARGAEFGICAGGNHMVAARDVVAPLRKILRRATAQDEKINSENRSREKRAFDICLQKIAHHQLEMQLVSAECAFDGSKLLFYFTADERVDFRELVKDLASVFHTRIELRQIGVRDKAKMVGGLGICGRPFCCASFLDDFQPVSIKMAKTQNLSLNPTKISGTCGRLMCCLKYEQDTYESLIRTSPKAESFVDTPDGRGTVVEVDILRQRVKVRMEENPETIGIFANTDIAVLRSGKAKKNDPPIPADLAPISGSGKRPRKQVEEAPILEPIRFRYSTEAIVEETPAPRQETEEVIAEPAEPAENTARSRRRRGNRPEGGPRPEQKREKPEKAEKPEKREKTERTEKPEKREKTERRERPERAEKPAQQKPEVQAEQPAEAQQKPEARAEQPAEGRQERQEGRRRRGDRPRPPRSEHQPDKREKTEKPEQKTEGSHAPEGGENKPPRHQNRPPRRRPQPEGQQPQSEHSAGEAPAAGTGENRRPRRRPNYRPRRPKNGTPGGSQAE